MNPRTVSDLIHDHVSNKVFSKALKNQQKKSPKRNAATPARSQPCFYCDQVDHNLFIRDRFGVKKWTRPLKKVDMAQRLNRKHTKREKSRVREDRNVSVDKSLLIVRSSLHTIPPRRALERKQTVVENPEPKFRTKVQPALRNIVDIPSEERKPIS